MQLIPLTNLTPESLTAILPQDAVVRWDTNRMAELCSLDIDFDSISDHDTLYCQAHLSAFSILQWPTQHGFRSIVTKQTLFDGKEIRADELAACAGWVIQRDLEGVQIELKTDTRLPGAIGAKWQEQIFNPRECIAQLFYSEYSGCEVGEDEVVEWLALNSIGEVGSRLEHTNCPIDPCVISGNPPVLVTERGLRCFRCESIYGDGFRSYEALIKGKEYKRENPIRSLVWNRVHWGHAQYVLRHYTSGYRYTKLLYGGMLKLGCNDENLWETGQSVFWHNDLPRTKSLWLNTDFSVPTGMGLHSRISSLPACKFIDSENKLKPSIKREHILLGNDEIELRKMGYFPLRPVGYVDLAAKLRTNETEIVAEYGGFQYVPKNKRALDMDCWEYLNCSFPGIDTLYVKCLAIMAAWSQLGQGEPPQMIVIGPSGGGKSLTPQIVSSLLKGVTSALTPSRHIEHILQQVIDNCTATFLIQDEVFKTIFDPVEYISIMNRIKPGAVCRKLYVGQVRLDICPPLISTDVSMPEVFQRNEQITRRAVIINLVNPAGEDWRVTSGGLDSWALHPMTEQVRNVFISEMLDTISELWDSGVNTFTGMAEALGATREVSQAGQDYFERFYAAYDKSGAHNNLRYSYPNWKAASVNPLDTLGAILKEWVFDLTGEQISDNMNTERAMKVFDPIHAGIWKLDDRQYRIELRVAKGMIFVKVVRV